MKKQPLFFILTMVCLLLLSIQAAAPAHAAEKLSELDSWTAQEYAQHLVDKFTEVKGKQVKLDANADEASGLSAGGGEGIILVPARGVKEGEENDAVYTEKGAGLACLFMSPRFNPMVDGKQIAQEKLLSVNYIDQDGDEKMATCLLLAIRNVEGDDWRLYAYGKDKKPVIDAKFGMAEEEAEGVIAMVSKEASEKDAKLVFTLFGKYAANFKIGQ
ncbi:MAG: hypothetical protein ABGX16_20425 [Pirellulales bacterium]